GVGLTLLLHCDLVFVEPAADLSAPFVALGLVPEAASSLLLPRVIGERRASEVFLTGRHISGAEAVEWGLANAVASPVLPAALEAAERVAAQPHHAARSSKALLRSRELTVQGRMAEEMEAFADALKGPEFAEVMAARRAPRPEHAERVTDSFSLRQPGRRYGVRDHTLLRGWYQGAVRRRGCGCTPGGRPARRADVPRRRSDRRRLVDRRGLGLEGVLRQVPGRDTAPGAAEDVRRFRRAAPGAQCRGGKPLDRITFASVPVTLEIFTRSGRPPPSRSSALETWNRRSGIQSSRVPSRRCLKAVVANLGTCWGSDLAAR